MGEGGLENLRLLFVVSGHWTTDRTTDKQIVMIAAESNSFSLFSEPDNVSGLLQLILEEREDQRRERDGKHAYDWSVLPMNAYSRLCWAGHVKNHNDCIHPSQ